MEGTDTTEVLAFRTKITQQCGNIWNHTLLKKASAFFSKENPNKSVKKKIGASLPEHITDKIELYAKGLSITPTEYLAQIAKDWFARGCPAVSAEEKTLRETRPAKKAS